MKQPSGGAGKTLKFPGKVSRSISGSRDSRLLSLLNAIAIPVSGEGAVMYPMNETSRVPTSLRR